MARVIATLPVDDQVELFSHHVDNDLADQQPDDPLATNVASAVGFQSYEFETEILLSENASVF
jgi:hypothetical protein